MDRRHTLTPHSHAALFEKHHDVNIPEGFLRFLHLEVFDVVKFFRILKFFSFFDFLGF